MRVISGGILEGLQALSLQWFRNATEASARSLLEIVERHVSGVQRYLKRVVERWIFTVLLARHGVSDVPSINWGVSKTGVEDLDLRGLVELVKSGALTSKQAQKLMVMMGCLLRMKRGRSSLKTQPFHSSNLLNHKKR